MRKLLVFAACLFVACAAGAVDEPAPEPEDREPPNEDVPEAGTLSDREDAVAPGAATPCSREPAVEQLELPDGGRLAVPIVEECQDVPDRDLGDPPP